MRYTVPTSPEYYGQEVTSEEAELLARRIADTIRSTHPDIEVVMAEHVPPIETYDLPPEVEDLHYELGEVAERVLEEWADSLVGVTEIAQAAGVRPDTVHKWRRRHADFPPPVANLASGPIWRWEDVEAWLARERKPGRPRSV